MGKYKYMTDHELALYADTHLATAPDETLNAYNALLRRLHSHHQITRIMYNIACIYRDSLELQNYEESFYYMRRSAENGYCPAQLNLGTMYKEGMGIEKDFEKSIFWFEEAANQGSVDAQYSLGIMFQIFQHDYTKARYWYEKAIEQNDACAKYNLGHMYEKGQGVVIDLHKALHLYNQAADQGLEDAKFARLRLIQKGIAQIYTSEVQL